MISADFFIKHKSNIKYYITYLLSDILNKALPFLLLPILTRLMSKEGYGALTEFTVLYNISFMVGAFSVQAYFRKLFFEKRNLGKRYLSFIFLSLSILVMLVFFFNGLQYINPQILVSIDLVTYVAIVFSILALIVIRITTIFYNCSFEPLLYLKNNILLTLVNLFLTFLFLYYFDFFQDGRILAILFAPLTFFPFAVASFIRRVPLDLKIKFEYIKKQLKFGLPLLPHQIMSWLRISYDRIIISTSLGLATLGEFSANAQIAMVYFVVFSALNQALAPKILKEYKERKTGYTEFAKKFVALFLLVYAILTPALYIMAPTILGGEFLVDYKIVFVLSIAYLFNGFYFIYTHYLIQNDFGGALSKISATSALLHLGVIYLLIPKIGIDAVLIASVLSYFLAFVLVFLKVNREVGRENVA